MVIFIYFVVDIFNFQLAHIRSKNAKKSLTNYHRKQSIFNNIVTGPQPTLTLPSNFQVTTHQDQVFQLQSKTTYEWKAWTRRHQRGRRAPSSGTWPRPWSASHRGWSADGTARVPAWCCPHFCRTASGSPRSPGNREEGEISISSHSWRATHVEPSLVLAGLTVDVHGKHLLLGDHLQSLLCWPSDIRDGLQGWVEVACSHQITSKESIDLPISLEVIDIKCEVDCWIKWRKLYFLIYMTRSGCRLNQRYMTDHEELSFKIFYPSNYNFGNFKLGLLPSTSFFLRPSS